MIIRTLDKSLCSILNILGLDWTHLSAQSFVDFLIPFSIKEPAATINESCKPEPLPPVNKHLCHVPKTQNIFTGELKELPGKVVHAIKLGYDVDVLEIHLNELYDVIDYFIITESLESHYQQTKKPLIWELVQLQPRFKKFRDKVIHFVLDDADIVMPTPEEGIFGSERLQEKLRWEKLKKWSDRLLLLSDDDVIGFGDADEITNRLNIHRLRYCRLKSSVFDIGSWFAFGELKHAFASDFPVIGHPYTIGNPTYWKFGKAKNFHQSYPTYQRGNSGGYLLGGAHLTHYSYIPYLLIKSLTATEADKSFGKIRSIVEKISSNDINTNSKSVLNLIVRKLDGFMKMVPSTRFVEVQKLVKRESNYAEVMIVPWFLKCNPERYPSWYGHYDDLRLLYS